MSPAIFREASLGDYSLNGATPSASWSAFFDAGRIKKNCNPPNNITKFRSYKL